MIGYQLKCELPKEKEIEMAEKILLLKNREDEIVELVEDVYEMTAKIQVERIKNSKGETDIIMKESVHEVRTLSLMIENLLNKINNYLQAREVLELLEEKEEVDYEIVEQKTEK